MWEEYVRIIGGKMKFANTNRTDNGEGKPLCTCIFNELTCYGVNNNKWKIL